MASASGSAGSSHAAIDNDSASGGFAMSEQRLCKTPLWRHVMVLETHEVLRGNAKSKCLYYGIIIPKSYSRVKTHLLRETGKGTSICNAATLEMVAQFHAEEVVAKSSAQDSSPRSVPMPVQLPVTQSRRPLISGKRKKQLGIVESFHNKI
jgi:hypothetical protein